MIYGIAGFAIGYACAVCLALILDLRKSKNNNLLDQE